MTPNSAIPTRPIVVYVSKLEREGRKPAWCAYTYWYSPSWKRGRCLTVEATTGTEAKKLAIAEAKRLDALGEWPGQ